MIYRVIQRLSVGKGLSGYAEPGETVSDADLGYGIVAILVKKGAISPVSAPPLAALPGWKLRAKRFTEAGYDAIALLECETELIARETGYKEQSIKKWKKELRDFMGVKRVKARSGCSKCPEPLPEPEPEVEIEFEPELELEPEFELIEQEIEQEQIEEVTEHATD